MKIPFDIKYKPQIESGEYKIETRDGRPARVICWDRVVTEYSDYIVALVTGTESETAYYYYEDGHLWSKANDEGDSSLDLFLITPEPELTEFEIHLLDWMSSDCGGDIPMDRMKHTVRARAKELLELVKKEICKGCTVGLDQYWKGREDAKKEYERPITFHYPSYTTYERLCFHGGVCTNPMMDCINCPRRSSGTINTSATNKAE